MMALAKATRVTYAVSLCLVLCCTGTVLAQPSGAMQDLGTFGGSSSDAMGVSSDGSIVVGRAQNATGNDRAFRWTAAGGMQDLGTLGGSYSAANGVSANGSAVVGVAQNAAQISRPFRWTAGAMQDLGTLGGSFAPEAHGASADGSVVVGVAYNAALHRRPFRWTAAGGMQDLGTLGGSSSTAYSVSADGSIVVGMSRNAAGQDRAFRWTASGGIQDLGIGVSSTAYCVSADGSVVVGKSRNAAAQDRAFRWTATGGMQDLGTLGGSSSTSYGVSADGSVVVGMSRNAAAQDRAFRWSASDGMQNLGTLGGSSSTAYGASANGAVVVGRSTNDAGQDRAFCWSNVLELIDANDARFRSSTLTGISTDPNLLCSGGVPRVGLCADGVTLLLLRSKSYLQGGSLRVSIRDEHESTIAADVGTLISAVNPNVSGTSIEVPLSPADDGTNRAYVLLRAPIDFVRAAHSTADVQMGAANPRILTIECEHIAPNGTHAPPVLYSTELHRPPIVLVHGLEDNSASWNWNLTNDINFDICYADYWDSHSEPFWENRFVPSAWANVVLGKMRSERIAATQVDIIGHSMGGLLARQWLIDPLYLRSDNFNLGDFHKLITVDTPHRGSAISALIMNEGGTLTEYGTRWTSLADIFSGRCTPCGAVQDLHPRSLALHRINSDSRPVPSHAIFGDGAADLNSHPYVERTRNILWPCHESISAFFGESSDAVVAVSSAKGGLEQLSPLFVTRIEGDQGLHYPIIHDFPAGLAEQRIIQLLNAPVSPEPLGPLRLFSDGFPVFLTPLPADPPCVLNLLDTAGQLGFSSPQPGAHVLTGQLMNVTISSSLSPASSVIIATSHGDIVELDGPPFSANISVPNDALGEIVISALATNAGGSGISVGNVTVTGVSPAPILSLHPEREMLDIPWYLIRISNRIMGNFSDGVTRTVTRAETGTTYQVTNNNVCSVDLNGVIRPKRLGTTSVTVSNGGFSGIFQVNVTSVMADMNCDGFLNALDIDPFIFGLLNPAAFNAQFPNCNLLRGDLNGDSFMNGGDIQGFVFAILGT